MISWTPYALVSMYSAFINPNDVTPLQSILPAMFAKSSTVLSSIFYILSNRPVLDKIVVDSELNRGNDLNLKEILSPSRSNFYSNFNSISKQ